MVVKTSILRAGRGPRSLSRQQNWLKEIKHINTMQNDIYYIIILYLITNISTSHDVKFK